MSNLNWQVSSSSNFQSFFSAITYNSSVSLYLMHFLLWTKGFHENTNFDTLNCSTENLPNSSCHLPNHKSVSLQILHDSSMSWNETLLYFFRSNVVYFAQKGAILLHKLEYYGIRGVCNDWFKSYLSDHKQFVSINGSNSN